MVELAVGVQAQTTAGKVTNAAVIARIYSTKKEKRRIVYPWWGGDATPRH